MKPAHAGRDKIADASGTFGSEPDYNPIGQTVALSSALNVQNP